MRKLLKILMLLLMVSMLLVVLNYKYVSHSAGAYLYNNLDEVDSTRVAVLLGTSRYVRGGAPNLYFSHRIEAAARLFKACKVQYIIVSGDNSTKGYNEPREMRKALVEAGVPYEKVILDYAGFRTLDSVVRAYKVFGQNRFIVISQEFHNERAIYIARHYRIEAVGFNAPDVKVYSGFKTTVREYLARVKMMLDLYLLDTGPKFLGDKEPVADQLPQPF